MTSEELRALAGRGEGPALELKRSTAELREAMQTLCAFLNGKGGRLIFGARPDGTLVGQQVSDKTLREIAQATAGLEPRVQIDIQRIPISAGLEALVLDAVPQDGAMPYAFLGIAYERVHSITRRMQQKDYETYLLERGQRVRRWESEPAEGLSPGSLDRAEVYRVVDWARAAGRLSGPSGGGTSALLRRLNVMEGSTVRRAAVVLFGKRFLPDYPQCELRMARFRGLDKTEFLDQKDLRGPALKLLEEAELFCQRHFPLPGRIVPGRLERVDRPLIPPDAMREILVNALIHRDYSIAGGAVSLAVFDDRVEVWSVGKLPGGVTPEMLSREHHSVLRNPLIADVFHRAGLIEKWGRGTNRVIERCRQHGIRPPEFAEIGGATVVTFRVAVGPTMQVTMQVAMQVTMQVAALLRAARDGASREELQRVMGLRNRVHLRKRYLVPLLRAGWLEMLIPDKPNSRLQRYRTTKDGLTRIPLK